MRRDHIVSVRLTAAELAALQEMGVPSDVLRDLLNERIRAANQAVVRDLPTVHPQTFAASSGISWYDGTAGAQWPASVTA